MEVGRTGGCCLLGLPASLPGESTWLWEGALGPGFRWAMQGASNNRPGKRRTSQGVHFTCDPQLSQGLSPQGVIHLARLALLCLFSTSFIAHFLGSGSPRYSSTVPIPLSANFTPCSSSVFPLFVGWFAPGFKPRPHSDPAADYLLSLFLCSPRRGIIDFRFTSSVSHSSHNCSLMVLKRRISSA